MDQPKSTIMDKIVQTYNFNSSCFYDEEKKIRFDPPVYEQRYLTVLRMLELDFWKSSFKKVVEFGCAEMKFFTLLKTLPDVEQILQVDIDEELLNKWIFSVRPLFVDFIQRRPSKFSVEVWRGSIASPHECLKGTDVVVGIEIIEHLFPLVLEAVPENVFGFIRPKVAMFSTPNSEYNVMFDGLLETGFRHDDHKFEWTRAQFEEWCENICHRYPEYEVKYFGIGPPPKDHPNDIGYVSQLGVFVRKDFLAELEASNVDQSSGNELGQEAGCSSSRTEALNGQPEAEKSEPKIYFDEEVGEIVMTREEDEDEINVSLEGREPEVFRDELDELESPEEDLEGSDDDGELNPRVAVDYYIPPAERARHDSGNYDDEPLDPTSDEYKLLYNEDYPVQEPDRRERPERLLDEAEYQIRRLKFLEEEYYNYEQNIFLIPLQLLVECMSQVTTTLEELKPILERASYRISEDNIITLTGDDESLLGSEEDFEYDLREEDDPAAEENVVVDMGNEPPSGNDESVDRSFQDDEEMWD